jgi:hypothetical protein
MQYFSNWKENISAENEFISHKLWFDIQSMILGFISLVRTKLNRFPGSLIKPAILNQDVLENHFSQLRGANGQNDNPSYQLHGASNPKLSDIWSSNIKSKMQHGMYKE